MKILDTFKNLFSTINDLCIVGSSNDNDVREFSFYNKKAVEIKLNNNLTSNTYCFRFKNPIQCDFDKYQKIELLFMMFDKTKLSIQSYADNYSELSKFFNHGKPQIEGILYFGRDSKDKRKIKESLVASIGEFYIHKSYSYESISNNLLEVNYFLIGDHTSNLLSNEVSGSSASQLCYEYSTIFLKDTNDDTYVKPTVEIFCFGLIGPIIGENFVSVKQEKISLVTGFRLTKLENNTQEIHFTKCPLTFSLENDKDHYLNNMLSLKKDELDILKQHESIEDKKCSETTKLSEQVTVGNSTIEYCSHQNCDN